MQPGENLAAFMQLLNNYFFFPLYSSETVNFARPFARRAANTRRPFFVAILSRKPCLFFLFLLEGWNVLFIVLYFYMFQSKKYFTLFSVQNYFFFLEWQRFCKVILLLNKKESNTLLSFFVIPKRFERLTHALEGRCSIQLSYGTDLCCKRFPIYGCKDSAFLWQCQRFFLFFYIRAAP